MSLSGDTLRKKSCSLLSTVPLLLLVGAIWFILSTVVHPVSSSPQEVTPQQEEEKAETVPSLMAEGAVDVSVTILPTRYLVVDENETIIEVWSNTDAAGYTLFVKQGKVDGPETAMTEKIRAQYEELLDSIDWQQRGRVY
ncbi:MAG: hypothetical protein ACE5NP_01945 [Anaerolineae bacterium]